MPRATLTFQLSGTQVQGDLIEEFGRHDGVDARATTVDGDVAIRVETGSSSAARWEVRATVGMFDDHAREISQ
ncbi:hypothetical protein [Aeromicrobium sp.]|uniref:hypothetical protein n=1 Tax=Aeromicrobium sp. TaxID=1871063 RepID=UPI003C579408